MKLIIYFQNLTNEDIEALRRETAPYNASIHTFGKETKLVVHGIYDDLVNIIHSAAKFGKFNARLY